MISRDPFGSDELNPLCAKGDQGWAGAHSTGSWEEAGRQTGRHVCAQTVRQLLAPLSVPTYCPYWHLPSALSQEEGTKAGSGRAGQPISPSPSLPQPRYCPHNLPSGVCSEQAGLWRRRERGDGRWARPEMPSPLHPVSPPTFHPPPPYLLRPRLRRSPQARILFWASMCVRFPAFSPSMLSTQSPTATPACAALPPGVS